ncbi:HAMP domain-containing histidine kinase [Campylobacter sp. PS10]|uniref:histidine kinase n=2 Tax=Campylobacter gastrosuis TaxID=2974576 RepID=A0ABT7HLW0_9BACT|nr:HAMP domain-containing sensor histidine kinase [Campylobacter gastrosuis]MDL0087945.1 HAMP domain-containing histidine kinase [Campylobacter gastrosuis]
MVLIAIVSVMLYYYIRITILETVVSELTYEAKEIVSNYSKFNPENKTEFKIYLSKYGHTDVKIITTTKRLKKPSFKHYNIGKDSFMELSYDFDENSCLKLTKDTTMQTEIIAQILIDILIVNVTAICLVIFYAMFLSRMLLVPIKTLTARLSKLNEKFLQEIDAKSLPVEFSPLANGINGLINRIQTFVSYQKELFIGIAHELKTPLAVMKAKNEVTLLKQRESERYIEALKTNNEAINSMNAMIGSVLEIGRQEGAQFEEPVMTDIIAFLAKLGNNFAILAKAEEKDIILELSPKILNIKIQQSLLTHVVQNFVQNAIKFSPKGSQIIIKTQVQNSRFIIKVLDFGSGIDESKDLFAPFKRYGEKGGAGLGLFLAKGAAQALGADISIKNRTDSNGAVATLSLPINTKRG